MRDILKFSKNETTGTTKYFVLGLVFLVTVLVTFFSMKFEQVTPSATTMDDSSLPTVMMLTDEGTEFNLLHGYTVELDACLMYGNITPVSLNKKLPISVNTYGENVNSITYIIRNLSDKSLIEKTEVENLERDGDKIKAVFNIKNLIDSNREYAMEIVLNTDKHDEIHYYTRIITGGEYKLQDKINFVMDFNECTFDDSKLKNISTYLETSKAGDNSNYGKVNINCSLSQVGWGTLSPFVESEIVPTIISINNEIGIISLNYRVGAVNNYASYDSYNVSEYYRVRQTNNGFYLLNYEREMNQIFDAKNDLTSSSKINLGINSSSNVNCIADEKGVFTYFVNQGSLWCFNSSSETYTKTFSFDKEDSDAVREGYQKHDIKIISVDENGDATFTVQGYMNRGKHEGEVGVSLCKYDYVENVVTELLYIPINISPDFLFENVGGVAYVADDKFYILIDETLYSVDLASKDVMKEVEGLKEGTFAVSESGDAIAYSKNGSLYDAREIRILNMRKATDFEIVAPEGDSLRPLGYIQSDFIYGVAHKSDILKREDGSIIYAMYHLGIIDVDYNTVKEYEMPGIYVSGSMVDGMRITLTRLVKSEDGYSSTSIDQLINKDENHVENGLETEVIGTEDRKQEVFIDLITQIQDLSVTYRTAKEVVFKDNTTLEMDDTFDFDGKYYVYGVGKFQGSKNVLENAVALGYDTFGTVINSDAKLIWKRFRNSDASIDGINSDGTSGSDTLRYSLQLVCNYIGAEVNVADQLSQGKTAVEILNGINGVSGVNLSNVPMDNVLGYVSDKIPVIGRVDTNLYVIIVAYNSKNVTYVDVENGGLVTVPTSDAHRLFAEGGGIFITYFK